MNTLTQYEYHLEAEYKRWEILLSTIKNENTFLMLKLSEVLDGTVDKDFIIKAEYFQNEFIVKGDYIKGMERYIKAEVQLISGGNDEKASAKISSRYEKFKNEIKYFERNFLALKMEFEKSITKISLP